jgi:hypothetical protein
MMDNPIFYTASMAKVCAEQGYFDKSMTIYRYLLESDSGNEVFVTALAEVAAKQAAVDKVSVAAEERLEGLEPMIQKWIGLLVEHDLKSKFDKIRKTVKKLQSSDHEA